MKQPPLGSWGGCSGEVLRWLHHENSTLLSTPQPNSPPPPIMSRAVNWWTVHEFVAPVLARVGPVPLAGSVEWQQLADDDPKKIAALFDAARHHALRVDMAQEAVAKATHAIAASGDWSGVAARTLHHSGAYTPREVA